MKILTIVLSSLVALLVLVYCLAAPVNHQWLAKQIAFYPGPEPVNTEKILLSSPCIPERLTLNCAGDQISALYLKNPEARFVCLYSHGNAGSMIYRSGKLNALYLAGLSVLTYDYAGFGKSSGHPSFKNATDNGLVACRYLLEHGYKPEQIVLYGESIGGGVSSEIARQIDVRALVLDSTFTSPSAWVQGRIPALKIYPPFMIASPQLNTLDLVTHFKGDILVVCPGEDETIPVSHSQKLFDCAARPKTMVILPDSAHATVSPVDYKLYSESLKQFVKSL